MEAILSECVQNSLRNFMYGNAIFMCHRLCAECPSETNFQLLAVCYLNNNQAYSAYHVLKGLNMAQSRYLFAQSCFKMDLLAEAEKALCPPNDSTAEVPNGAAGHYLLGLIYRYTDRRKCAIQHFRLALSLDPLLWAAYEELCILGAAEEAAIVFDDGASLCVQKQYIPHGSALRSLQPSSENHGVNSSKDFGSEDLSPSHVKHMQSNSQRDVYANHQGLPQAGGAVNQPFNVVPTNASFYNTPSPIATTTQVSGVAPPPVRRNVPLNGPNPSAYGVDGSAKSNINTTLQAPRRKFVDEGKLRKVSGRLFTDSGPRRSIRLSSGEAVTNMNSSVAAISGNGINHSSKYVGGSKLSAASLRTVTGRKGQSWGNENSDEVSGTKNDVNDDKHISSTTSSPPGYESRSLEQEGPTVSTTGALDLLALLRILGEGYRLFCIYRCQEALDIFTKLSQKHYNTGWVLSQVGKSYFEMVNYVEANCTFSLARLACPHSLEGMDIYSTVLYHLKEDMKLSYLAQELISIDRLAPQSWCALGNCYSLQKDHETALKNFQRAVQLDPRFAYAHTLCGHEYVALEDYENGIKCYQSALRVDDRHYNAWYGLGMVYLRQEKLEFSEHHFRKAFQINSRSSVIMSYLGTALQALKRSKEALEIMEKAVLADKKNPLPLYQKAIILVSMDNLDGALQVLEELKECVPRESSVYALMGRIYKKRNMFDQAMLHFGHALDMNPPTTDVATIKAAIEMLHVPDELADDL